MNYAFYTRGRLTIYMAALVAGGIASPAQASGVAAGTLIENTATASYSTGSSTETVNSNTVSITVDELLDVALASLDGGNVPLGSEGAVLGFQLTNAGNGPEAFAIEIDAALAGDDFDPAVTELAYDSNGNGSYDAGVDAVIAAGGDTPVVPADGTLTLFVVTGWGGAPGNGELADLRLTARAATGSGAAGTVFAGQGESGADAVVGANGASDFDQGRLVAQVGNVTLTKSALISDPFGGSQPVPGASVTYRLVAQVSGSGSVADLVVSDSFPNGTSYAPATLTLDSAALTDATGDDAGEASATGISVNLGTVAGGSTRTITFDVTID